MLLRLALVAFLALPISLTARADTLETFNLAGSLTDGSTFSGSAIVDLTNGAYDSISLSYMGGVYSNINLQNFVPAQDAYVIYVGQSDLNPLFILATAGPMNGFTGGPMCSLGAPCGGDGSSAYQATVDGDFVLLQAGTMTDAGPTGMAVTPEPSSVALLGTGLLGMVFALKRTFRNREQI